MTMVLAVGCAVGYVIAGAEHAGTAAAILLALTVVSFLTSWVVLALGVLRLKRDASRLLR